MKEFIIYKKENNERVMQSIVKTSSIESAFSVAKQQATELGITLYVDVDNKSYIVEPEEARVFLADLYSSSANTEYRTKEASMTIFINSDNKIDCIYTENKREDSIDYDEKLTSLYKGLTLAELSDLEDIEDIERI